MAATFFITGTDTDAGKTHVAGALLAAAKARGLTTAALKPVAAGTVATPEGMCNEDVMALAAQCTEELALAEINPVCFDEPIAPHIAAVNVGVDLAAATLAEQCQQVLARKADLTVVEGAGGWKVPLNAQETLADLVRLLDIPVILVVGMKLGCLNHALLTAQAIAADGLPLAGWVANHIDPAMARYQENRETLEQLLPAPLLAEMPRLLPGDSGAQYWNLDRLLTKG